MTPIFVLFRDDIIKKIKETDADFDNYRHFRVCGLKEALCLLEKRITEYENNSLKAAGY